METRTQTQLETILQHQTYEVMNQSKEVIKFNLAKEFSKNFKNRYGAYCYSLATIKTSKWWIHFERASEYVKFADDIPGYVRFLFMKYSNGEKMLYPYVLSFYKAKKAYEDYVELQNIYTEIFLNDKTKIVSTLKEINEWCRKNNVENNKLETFIKNNFLKIERDRYYTPLFYFSKYYMDNHELKEDETIDIINTKRLSFKINNPQFFEQVKRLLEDDFIEPVIKKLVLYYC